MDLRAQLQEWSHAFQTLALRKHIHFVLDVNDDRTDCLMALDAERWNVSILICCPMRLSLPRRMELSLSHFLL